MPGPYIFYLFHSTRFHKDKKSKDPRPGQGMQVAEFERLIVRVSKEVQQELMGWFGDCVSQWCHLRTDLIPEALPEQTPKAQKDKPGFIQQKGIYVCGDHATSASIEGAVISGKRAAEAIIMRRLPVL